MTVQNKRKILNDPVYGFIHIPDTIIFEVIEHPFFQRLRRIQQLGLTHYVYPGALHTRFHHAIGAMHLMSQALENIKNKGHNISEEEYINACLAILLHDIGHGPFSHALEHVLLQHLSHERISDAIIEYFNNYYNGSLQKALLMFRGKYPRKFFNQLISGQLDVDRLDYLTRDSFFTGVNEGVIGTDRILKMMNVCGDNLVIEEKGIHSVERFLVSRQLMYWQVYFHKTVMSAEILLINVIQRAQALYQQGVEIFLLPQLKKIFDYSGQKNVTADFIDAFCSLDDFDIMFCLKQWCSEKDPVLVDISRRIIDRKLFRTIITEKHLPEDTLNDLKNLILKTAGFEPDWIDYYFTYMPIHALVYDPQHNPIKILYRNGNCFDILECSTILQLGFLSQNQVKYVIAFPKSLTEVVSEFLQKV